MAIIDCQSFSLWLLYESRKCRVFTSFVSYDGKSRINEENFAVLRILLFFGPRVMSIVRQFLSQACIEYFNMRITDAI